MLSFKIESLRLEYQWSEVPKLQKGGSMQKRKLRKQLSQSITDLQLICNKSLFQEAAARQAEIQQGTLSASL